MSYGHEFSFKRNLQRSAVVFMATGALTAAGALAPVGDVKRPTRVIDNFQPDLRKQARTDGFIDINVAASQADICDKLRCTNEGISTYMAASLQLGRCTVPITIETYIRNNRVEDILEYDLVGNTPTGAVYTFEDQDDLEATFGEDPCVALVGQKLGTNLPR